MRASQAGGWGQGDEETLYRAASVESDSTQSTRPWRGGAGRTGPRDSEILPGPGDNGELAKVSDQGVTMSLGLERE